MDDGKLSIIDAVNSDKMLISWDVGRRCNYDCTYCPAHRHDNVSPHASMEELQASAQFVFDYLELLMPHKVMKQVSISFTGGEPTANPNFIKFGQWLRKTHTEKYTKLYQLDLSLTTNGAMGKKMCDSLLVDYQFATVSYHVEADAKLKKKVVDNILYLHGSGFGIKVNVMFHADAAFFDECRALCDLLAENGVDFVPRMIGEYQDNNRYHHKYTPAQAGWMKTFWNEQRTGAPMVDVLAACTRSWEAAQAPAEPVQAPMVSSEPTPAKSVSARSVGRPCCGKRNMNVCSSSTGEWTKTTFITNAQFEDWFCTVNWFFLHIEQQTGNVYHHQTCQANFGKKREPITHLSDTSGFMAEFRGNIEARTMPVIVCPNKICGCGLCTPKAAQFGNLEPIMERHIDMSIFENNPLFK